ncbi:hypothetical protein [Terribacillus aidingensis]|uniref:serine O-acetyltransferase n=1 Tax=Terribacillus aidingensis TaxID=586416 RepID=UPI00344BF83D
MIESFQRLGGIHGIIVMSFYRYGNWVYYKVKIPGIRHILWTFYRLIDFCFVRLFLNCEIPAQCHIGKNIRLPHGGNGIILHKNVIIKDNVTIFHQVTLGIVNYGIGLEKIVVENGALIGCGAKILGNVTIGENAKVGANTVVLKDVPVGYTAVGSSAELKLNNNNKIQI